MLTTIIRALWLLSLVAMGMAPIAPLLAADAGLPGALPAAVVERFHGALMENMKTGKQTGFEARRKRLEPVVKEAFDLPNMARLSTGSAWAKMAEADHERIVAAFAEWTIANYAANFKEWDGETFVTKGTTDHGKGDMVVNTQLAVKNDPPVIFDYRMRQQNGAWRVIDIYLDGAISQLAMHRGEFAAALSKGGVDHLIEHMRSLTAEAQKKGG